MLASSPLADRPAYGHSSSNSHSGLPSVSSSSSLGPIRTRHSSITGSLGRSTLPSTPPRTGALPHPLADERWRNESRSRQAQSLKDLVLSPPTRRAQFEGDGFSDQSMTPQRHRPGSSTGGSFTHMMTPLDPPVRMSPGHVSTISDPSPMLPPGYVPGRNSVSTKTLDQTARFHTEHHFNLLTALSPSVRRKWGPRTMGSDKYTFGKHQPSNKLAQPFIYPRVSRISLQDGNGRACA